MVVLDALQSILTIITMVSIAYVLTSRGWFDQNTARLFSRLAVMISLPAFMFSSFMSVMDREELSVLGISFIYPLLSMLLMFVIGLVVIRAIKVSPGRRGIFLAMFSLSNTIFIGLPVNVSLFGEVSVPYVVLFYTVNTMLFWTIAVYAIRRDHPSGYVKEPISVSLKKIASPPLVAFILTMVLIILDIRPPRFILDTAGYLGNLTTPLSMLFMGIVIHSIDLKKLKIDREMLAILAGRFIIAPVVAYLLFIPADIPLLMKKVFIIEAAMPVMTQAAIVAQTYGSDHKYVTLAAAVSTMVGMLFIPIYMLLLGNI